MPIKPITGVSAPSKQQPDCSGPLAAADFVLQMLRRGLVLDLSVAFGKLKKGALMRYK